jgi:hypothetical protein
LALCWYSFEKMDQGVVIVVMIVAVIAMIAMIVPGMIEGVMISILVAIRDMIKHLMHPIVLVTNVQHSAFIPWIVHVMGAISEEKEHHTHQIVDVAVKRVIIMNMGTSIDIIINEILA